jgi:hypothetical protein
VPWKPDYASAADANAYLRIGDVVDNTQLALWCTAASRAIDKRCNRQFGQSVGAVARTYEGQPFYNPGSARWELEIDDTMVLPTTVNGVAWASAGYVMLPLNAPLEGVPWQRIGTVNQPAAVSVGAPLPITVTAQWGWSAIPSQVVAATLLQVARWNARRDSPYGIAGSPDSGSEMRLLARLDPDVATSLAGLSRRRRVG